MPNFTNTPPKPWRLMFICIAALWGSSFLFMRGAALELGVWPTAFLRMAIGALTLMPILLWRGQFGALKRSWVLMCWMSLINSAIPFACYAFAVLHITTGLSAILNATTPLLTALVAWLWLGAKLSPSRLIGAAIAFAGIALLVGEQASLKGDSAWVSISAVLACLVATSCYAIAGNVIKEKMTTMHPWEIAFGTMFGAALWLAVPAALTWPSAPISSQAWLSVGAAGVFCSALALMLYFELLRRTDTARTASVTYLIPVFALFYGVILLNESITLWMLTCGLVVLMGTALATRVSATN
jgi:drug/metabolite transporter (DMT)-like permease